MKRNFAILGILMLSAWFAACSNSKTSAESNDSSKVVVDTENTAKSATQSTNKLPAVEGTKTATFSDGCDETKTTKVKSSTREVSSAMPAIRCLKI